MTETYTVRGTASIQRWRALGTPPLSVGVELETMIPPADIDAVDTWCARTGAVRIHDISIRSAAGYTPAELVLPPTVGLATLGLIGSLGRLLNKVDAGVNLSTGLHVHVGVADMDYWTLRRLLRLWYAIEPVIYGFFPHRRKCRFALPMQYLDGMYEILCINRPRAFARALCAYMCNMDEHAMQSLASDLSKDFPEEKWQRRAWCRRYVSLNILAIHKYGTVEYRCSESSIDHEYIYSWTMLCAIVTYHAMYVTDRQVNCLFDGMIDAHEYLSYLLAGTPAYDLLRM